MDQKTLFLGKPAEMGLNAPRPSATERAAQARAGLCARCDHLQLLRSKTSTFIRCARSDHDSDFARYPPLPVHDCRGFTPVTGTHELSEPAS